ncbi:hypothetical protein BDV96DRAFT_192365 [Lophiotrema nucula]|uniref:Uncharacterized protein n=1 Tax=Lophiotrema nucula TaxID=690887 RepID=A0A6A5YWB4_9PLEO|nr:hypothetical protein BDV96DRAFT_192365 [Lophiotrema nucula]
MATTRARATRSSGRLSSQPSNEPPASPTPTKKKALRGSTPKASATTPRSKRKAAAKGEPQPAPKPTPTPAPAEDQEEEERGLFFTHPEIFSATTLLQTTPNGARSRTMPPRPVNPAPQTAEPSQSSQSSQPSQPSPPNVQVTRPRAETQELYDRIAQNGYLARTQGLQALREAEEVDVAAPEEDQEVQEQDHEQTTIVISPAPALETPKRIPQARRKAPQTARPKSRTQTKTPATKKAKSKRAPDSLIVSRALESIDPRHHDQAREWVEQAALKLAEEAPGKPGEKRKRFETGLRVADIEEIPAHYPWEQGGAFGLLDEFDDSDDEAPAWYVLDQLANNRPIKRRKAAHDTIMDENIPSLNDLANRHSPPVPKRSSPIFNSHGNTARLNDLHPRSAIVPSPMFDSPIVYQPLENIFRDRPDSRHDPGREHAVQEFGRIMALERDKKEKEKSKDITTSEHNNSTFEKELKRTGHVEGSGVFAVPEDDSSSDEAEEVEDATQSNGDPSWLKRSSQQTEPLQPPPPPIPAHATLPSPIKASPIVPPIQHKTRPVREDPVKIQRALAMKHTPAKPSRLREATLPSPSLQSDAGNDSIIAINDPNVTIFNDDGMPQHLPLDLDIDIEEYVTNVLESDSFKLGMASAWGGSDVILRYDEDEEL